MSDETLVGTPVSEEVVATELPETTEAPVEPETTEKIEETDEEIKEREDNKIVEAIVFGLMMNPPRLRKIMNRIIQVLGGEALEFIPSPPKEETPAADDV